MRTTDRRFRKYETWKRAIEAAGFRAEVRPPWYTDGMNLYPDGRNDHRLPYLWVSKRDQGVVLVLCNPFDAYHVSDPGRVIDLCLTLLKRMNESPESPCADQTLQREYGLGPISWRTLADEQWEERVRHYAMAGWRILSPEEDQSAYDRIWERYFDGGPRLDHEPEGSLVWDISSATTDDLDTAERLQDDLTIKVLKAFRACTQPGESLYVLRWNTPGWSFDPRADIPDFSLDSMAVPFLPVRDPVLFVAKDVRFGLLAPYFQEEMYVFGAELIEAFGRDWPDAFTRLLRKTGPD